MKDEKAKYLMIDSKDILNQLYNFKRVACCNDFDNWYYKSWIVSLSEVFDKYGVPRELQKVIVKINIPFFIKREAYEFTTKFPFDLTAGKIKKQDGKKHITVSSCPIFHNNMLFRDKVKFTTKLEYVTYTDVVEFLRRVSEGGYEGQYLKVLKIFFATDLRLDSLFREEMNEEDLTKGVKRYMKNL